MFWFGSSWCQTFSYHTITSRLTLSHTVLLVFLYVFLYSTPNKLYFDILHFEIVIVPINDLVMHLNISLRYKLIIYWSCTVCVIKSLIIGECFCFSPTCWTQCPLWIQFLRSEQSSGAWLYICFLMRSLLLGFLQLLLIWQARENCLPRYCSCQPYFTLFRQIYLEFILMSISQLYYWNGIMKVSNLKM